MALLCAALCCSVLLCAALLWIQIHPYTVSTNRFKSNIQPLYIHYNESETGAPKVRNKYIDVIPKVLIIFYCTAEPTTSNLVTLFMCSWISLCPYLCPLLAARCHFVIAVLYVYCTASGLHTMYLWTERIENGNNIIKTGDKVWEWRCRRGEHKKLYDPLNTSIYQQKPNEFR